MDRRGDTIHSLWMEYEPFRSGITRFSCKYPARICWYHLFPWSNQFQAWDALYSFKEKEIKRNEQSRNGNRIKRITKWGSSTTQSTFMFQKPTNLPTNRYLWTQTKSIHIKGWWTSPKGGDAPRQVKVGTPLWRSQKENAICPFPLLLGKECFLPTTGHKHHFPKGASKWRARFLNLLGFFMKLNHFHDYL